MRFTSWFGPACVALVWSGCIARGADGEADLAIEAIRDGSEDVIRDRHGQQANTPAQWRRDATVAVLDGNCTGVLVTPRIVLTAWHCVAGLGSRFVHFGPIRPLGPGEPPAGLRASVAVPVIDVILPPNGDGGTEWDIAILVLGQRVDHGPTGRRSQVYPALPVPVGFEPPAGGWQHTDGRMSGFGSIAGDDRSSASYINVRQTRIVGIEAVDHILETEDYVGFADSGGPIYQIGPDGEPVATLGLMYQSWRDVDARTQAVRLSNPDVRAWLETFLERTRSVGSPPRDVWLGGLDVTPRGEEGRRTEPDDPDGDGLIGAHDNCPLIRNDDQADLVEPFGLGDVTATCVRSNGERVTYGCEVRDSDGDGIVDPCDNCDGIPNFDQRDCDGDGIGDACELDWDGDGVPDDCDNCDFVAAVSQANCNLDAELELGLEPLGDACDPRPCAQVEIQARARGTRVATDEISGFGVAADLDGEPPGRGTARTGFRWCPCDVANPTDTSSWRSECAMTRGCVVDPDAYDESASWRQLDQRFATHTHDEAGEIAISYDLPPSIAGLRRDRYRSAWDMLADARSHEEIRRVTFAGVTQSEVDAVLWAHTSRWATPTDGHPSVGPCRDGTSGCQPLGTLLNSHYWSGTFASVDGLPAVPYDDFRAPSIASFLEPEQCLVCRAFPAAFFRREVCKPFDECGLHVRVGGDDGARDVPIGAGVGRELAQDLANPAWSWLSADLRDGSDGIRAIAVERKGRYISVRRVVRAAGGKIEAATLPVSLALAPTDASALTEPQLLLRGGRGTLYALGADDDGLALVEVDLASGEQRTRRLNHTEAGHLVAAALHPTLAHAFAIERVKELGAYRLLRIDLERGEVIVHGRYDDSGTTLAHSMTVTPDGHVAIAAQTSDATRIAVLRWGDDKPRVLGQSRHDVLLDGGIVASTQGVSFAARSTKGGPWAPHGIRYEEMDDASRDLAPLF